MDASECSTDVDCEGTRLCFVNSSLNPQGGYCGCNSFKGWSGEDCSELGPQAILSVIFQSTTGITALVMLVITVSDIFMEVRLMGCCMRPRTSRITQCVLAAALVTFTCLQAVELHIRLNPTRPLDLVDKFDASTGQTGTFKVIRLDKAASYLMFWFQFFAVLSASFISMLWVELAEAADSRTYRTRAWKRTKKYRPYVYTFNTLFAISMSTILVLDQVQLYMLCALPFVIVLIFAFALGRSRLLRMLAQYAKMTDAMNIHQSNEDGASSVSIGSSKGDESSESLSPEERQKMLRIKTQNTILHIKNCSTRTIICLVMIIVFGVAATVCFSSILLEGGWRRHFPDASHANLPSMLYDLTVLSILLGVVALASYCHSNSKILRQNRLRRETERERGNRFNLDLSPMDGGRPHSRKFHASGLQSDASSFAQGGVAVFKHMDRDLPTMSHLSGIEDSRGYFSQDKSYM